MPAPLLSFCTRTAAFSLLLAATASVHGDDGDGVRFSRDVLPILSENCFFCHGPDDGHRAAELRLDTEEGASGVLARDSAADSELLRRILSDDPDEQMPPPDSNRRLTASQKETLRRWISTGAPWGQHWSFEPLVLPDIPDAAFSRFPVRNPIDAFVQHRLREENLTPSAEAGRHTLIRRVTLDLTGLPPTPDEVIAFLNDASPDAYEKVVDRLLRSTAYGERMAWDWLDAARYADTNGYQGDRERTMWPWRDWVVDAFNSNMPFDQFTTQQLAGDLLPAATQEQKLATGFCRNHMINGEGGRIPEENRVDYVMDMSETMGTVWLGLTLNCCRCHDHKYDPLTQQDYYQFFAFFNQTPVSGGGGDPQTAPNLAAPTPDQKQRLTEIEKQLSDVNAALASVSQQLQPKQQAWEQAAMARGGVGIWEVLTPVEARGQNMTLTAQDDQSVLAGGRNAVNDTYTIRYRLSRGNLTAIRLETMRHQSMTKGGLARSDSGNFVLTEIECHLIHRDTRKALPISRAAATFEQGGHVVNNTFDGNSKTGWAVYRGRSVDRNETAVFHLGTAVSVPEASMLEVVLRHDSVHAYHNIGRFRISATAHAAPSPSSENETLLAALRIPEQERNSEQQKRVRNAFLQSDANYVRLTKQRTSLTKQQSNLKKSIPKVMVMEDRSEWRPTYVLNRGLYNDVTDREVSARTPESLPAMSIAGKRADRLDLAQWLVSPEHPLTARVTVNRFWQQLFGSDWSKRLKTLASRQNILCTGICWTGFPLTFVTTAGMSNGS